MNVRNKVKSVRWTLISATQLDVLYGFYVNAVSAARSQHPTVVILTRSTNTSRCLIKPTTGLSVTWVAINYGHIKQL